MLKGSIFSMEDRKTERIEFDRRDEQAVYDLLFCQELIPKVLKQKDWKLIDLLTEYVRRDAPKILSKTDPALYKRIREAITEYHLRGWTHLHVPASEK